MISLDQKHEDRRATAYALSPIPPQGSEKRIEEAPCGASSINPGAGDQIRTGGLRITSAPDSESR